MQVQVDAVPVATANNSGEICVGGVATLTAGTVEGGSYQWRVAGAPAIVSTERSFGVRPTATTSYELTVSPRAVHERGGDHDGDGERCHAGDGQRQLHPEA